MAGIEIRITDEFRVGAAWLRTYNRPMEFDELSQGDVDVGAHIGLATVNLMFDLPR